MDVISAEEVLGFADDHTLLDSFSANDREAGSSVISKIESDCFKIKSWMVQNKLKMN